MKIIKILPILFLTLAVIPLSAQAFSFDELFDEIEEWFSDEINETKNSQVINEINVSANTGGNAAEEGEVKEGETKSRVYVKNIINGIEIEPIEIESDASEVKVESEIEVDEGKAYIQREIEIDSETSEESYEVDLEESDTFNMGGCLANKECFEEGENFKKVQEWWENFVNNLKSFFENIFSIF